MMNRQPTYTLRVVDGGSPQMRADEAHIERIAGLDEAVTGASRVYNLVEALALDYQDGTRPTDLRWARALNEIGRIGTRARAALVEIYALSGGEPAA